MATLKQIQFDDATIERLFGAEDAEGEKADRFKEYFYYNQAYTNLTADLPIRIVVGHKGVGKSALLRRAYLDDSEKGHLSVFIQPNDIRSLWQGLGNKSLNELIEEWKSGIEKIVSDKALDALLKIQPDAELPKVSVQRGVLAGLLGVAKHLSEKFAGNIHTELVGNFLKQQKIVVYIDDMDRGWEATEAGIRNMSALFNAVRDMSSQEGNIQFRLGLRSDVYYLVRTSDESTDKIERNVIWLEWTNHEILCVAAKRILTFFGEDIPQTEIFSYEQSYITGKVLSKVIEQKFTVGRGHWQNWPIHRVLLSLCRRRPRDLIKLFHGAAKNAFRDHSSIILSKHLEQSFSSYSEERLQDIINEFKSEMPNVKDLLLNMRPTKRERTTAENYRYRTDQLITKLANIRGRTTLRFTNKRPVTDKALLQFMYKIDFITARLDKDGAIERKYFDQSRFLADEAVDFGYNWEVHTAYRWALQPSNIQDVIDSLD